jgi:hypothetical protein
MGVFAPDVEEAVGEQVETIRDREIGEGEEGMEPLAKESVRLVDLTELVEGERVRNRVVKLFLEPKDGSSWPHVLDFCS